jgi:putative methyltransferase (TIGR04325 family)
MRTGLGLRRRSASLLRDVLPPVLARVLMPTVDRRFTGPYSSWEEARAASTGYDAPEILEAVKASMLKVRSGEAAWERDSVIFDSIKYAWPVLAGLLWAASRSDNVLNVLDFGGSLGTSYVQNLRFLEHLRELRWNIVEQEHFVRAGRESFETSQLRFYESVEECLSETRPNVLLVSGSLQFLEQPYAFVETLHSTPCSYLIFDRIPFLPDEDRVVVQNTARPIYDAAYASWFVNERRFLGLLEPHFELVAEFAIWSTIVVRGASAEEKGFLFERRDGSRPAPAG